MGLGTSSTHGAQMRLRDGRSLGYAEYGDPMGQPVLFFPGTPSCRLFRHPDESIAASLDARVIAVDRPGLGLSSFQPARTLLDWPADVVQLADALEIDRFAVAGISGGGPYVAACAYSIPQRLTRAGIVSGVGPVDAPGAVERMARERRVGVKVARIAPGLLRPVLWLLSNPRRDPDRYLERVIAQSSEPDRAVLERPEVGAMLVENWSEATRPGIRGFAWETVIFSRAWGFRLADISSDVHLWHGDADASIPLDMARAVADAITNCRLEVLPGEGHFLLFDRWAEILAALVA